MSTLRLHVYKDFFLISKKDALNLVSMATTVTRHVPSTVEKTGYVTFSLELVLGVNLDGREHLAT